MAADPDTERHRLFEAVTDFLAEMSHTDPVIVVLDDIHWSDKPSLLLLRHLLRSATPMRLLRARDVSRHGPRPHASARRRARRSPSRTRGVAARPRRPRYVGSHRAHGVDGRARPRPARHRPPLALHARPRGTRSSSARCCATWRNRVCWCSATAAGRATSASTRSDSPKASARSWAGACPACRTHANRALALGAVIGATVRPLDDRGRRRPARRRAVRRARSSRAALDHPRGSRRSRPLHVRARAHALGAVRGAHDEPARAHARTDRRQRSKRGTRIASTSTSTSSRTTSPRARWPVMRKRPSSTAAGRASGPTMSSRSRAPRRTTTARWARSSSSTHPIPSRGVTSSSRSRRRCSTRATNAGATPCSRPRRVHAPSATASGSAPRRSSSR